MPTRKTDNYMVTELKIPKAEAPWLPPIKPAEKGRGGRILSLDKSIAPNAFYLQCSWITEPSISEPKSKDSTVKPHRHDFDEIICFYGTNPDDIYDLGGEIEIWLGGEQHIIKKSCMVYIPAGLEHGPLIIRRVDRPIFNLTSGPEVKQYS